MRRMVWPSIGLLVLVGGLAWAAVAPAPGVYGWFAYTPLSEEPPGVGGGLVVVSAGRIAGLLVAALGVVVLAGWVGYRVGRRGRREPSGL